MRCSGVPDATPTTGPDFDTDIVIVGLGPTGATAANLLGARGVRVLVLERDMDIYPRQRAIAADEDALRIWQAAGLLDPILRGMSTHVRMHFHHRNRIFLSCDLRGRGHQGVPALCFFHQPAMEQVLREGLQRFAGRVELRAGHALVSIEQDEAGVTLGIRGGQAGDRRVRARFLIGCDGGSSDTRKLLGIALPGSSVDEPWIDIQARTSVPHDPAAPVDFHFIADPARPGAECTAPMGHRRWEFRLHRGEDPDRMNTPTGIRALLATRGVDSEAVEILKSWVYVFHVRQAERWKQGRAFLCGDAAHLMPPYAGQGMSSGIRDVGNLCWKIAAVIHGNASPSLLDSYESERRPNLRTATRFSRLVGAIVTVESPLLAACRDLACRILVRLPWIGRRIRDFHIKPDWISGPGMLTRRRSFRSPAGRLVWQPWIVTATGARSRLDDVLGPDWTFLSWRERTVPERLVRLGVREIVVHERQRGWRGLGEGEIVDIEDRLRLQFRRHRARGMLVRPDRFIYGSDRDDLAMEEFTRLSDLIPPMTGEMPAACSRRHPDPLRNPG